jgi:hypothetical protein
MLRHIYILEKFPPDLAHCAESAHKMGHTAAVQSLYSIDVSGGYEVA